MPAVQTRHSASGPFSGLYKARYAEQYAVVVKSAHAHRRPGLAPVLGQGEGKIQMHIRQVSPKGQSVSAGIRTLPSRRTASAA